MNIHPIRSETDYRNALRELSAWFDDEPAPGTPDGDRFEIMLTLVEAYEAKRFPIEAPDPIEAIKFRMEQGGLTVKDLGHRSASPTASMKSSTASADSRSR